MPANQRKLFVRAAGAVRRGCDNVERAEGQCSTCLSVNKCVCAKLGREIHSAIVNWTALDRSEWPTVVGLTEHEPPLKCYWPERITPLAINVVLQSTETYFIDGRSVAVDPHSYLIINEGTPYASATDSIEKFKTANIFLNAQMCADALAHVNSPIEVLLDGSQFVAKQPLRVMERLNVHDQIVSPIIRRIIRLTNYNESDPVIEECLHDLAEALVGVHTNALTDIEKLRFAKRSTRLEVYRRLAVCHDFILSNLEAKLSIGQIAAVAGFSAHHFLRVFREVYGTTPHRYITNVRLERARQVLQHSDKTVTEVCGNLGFESIGSFSSLYKSHFGSSPAFDRKSDVPGNFPLI